MLISAKTLQGKFVTLKNPISLYYDADRYIPCDSLKLTAAVDFDKPYDEFCEISVFIEDKLLFDGIVDRQKTSLSNSGRLLTLECRSKTALLIDNELKPEYYFKLTSDELFAKYLKPFGVLGTDFPFRSNKNFIQIKKGSSYFTLLYEFCRFVYKKLPYITRDKIVTLNPVNQKLHIISNTRRNALNYSSISINQLNYKIISKLYMRTGTDNDLGTGYYDAAFENDNAKKRGILRQRFYNPTDIVRLYKENETKQLIDEANRESFFIDVELPFIKNMDIGDQIQLTDSEFNYPNLYISSMSYIIAPKVGMITKLRLRDKAYA